MKNRIERTLALLVGTEGPDVVRLPYELFHGLWMDYCAGEGGEHPQNLISLAVGKGLPLDLLSRGGKPILAHEWEVLRDRWVTVMEIEPDDAEWIGYTWATALKLEVESPRDARTGDAPDEERLHAVYKSLMTEWPRSGRAAFFLWLCFGWVGAHAFYAGRIIRGAMIATCWPAAALLSLCGQPWKYATIFGGFVLLVDFILIADGRYILRRKAL